MEMAAPPRAATLFKWYVASRRAGFRVPTCSLKMSYSEVQKNTDASFRCLDLAARGCGLGQARQEAEVRRRRGAAYRQCGEVVAANTGSRSAVARGLCVVLYVRLQRDV